MSRIREKAQQSFYDPTQSHFQTKLAGGTGSLNRFGAQTKGRKRSHKVGFWRSGPGKEDPAIKRRVDVVRDAGRRSTWTHFEG